MAVPNRPRDDRIIDTQTGRMNPVWKKWFEYLSDMIDTVNVNGAKKFGIKEDRLPSNTLTTDDLGVVVVTQEQLTAASASVDMDTIQNGLLYKKPAATEINTSGQIKRVRVSHSGLTTGQYEGMVASATIDSGQTVALGSLLVRATDGELELLDLNKANAASEIFMSLGTGTGSQTVLCSGSSVCNSAWSWTVGRPIYASATAGALTQTTPISSSVSKIVKVGHAISATIMQFERPSQIGCTDDEHVFTLVNAGTWKAACAGGAGLSVLFAAKGTGASSKLYSSDEGLTWTELWTPGATIDFLYWEAASGYLYALVQTKIYRSNDGTTWTDVLTITAGDTKFTCMTFFEGNFIVGSQADVNDPGVYYSATGAAASWTRSDFGTHKAHITACNDLCAFVGSIYAACSADGAAYPVQYSLDGITWATESTGLGASLDIWSLAFFWDKLYCEDGVTVYSRADESSSGTWVDAWDAYRTLSSTGKLIVMGDYLWMLGSDTFRTFDGTRFRLVSSFTPSENATVCVFKNYLYAAGQIGSSTLGLYRASRRVFPVLE